MTFGEGDFVEVVGKQPALFQLSLSFLPSLFTPQKLCLKKKSFLF